MRESMKPLLCAGGALAVWCLAEVVTLTHFLPGLWWLILMPVFFATGWFFGDAIGALWVGRRERRDAAARLLDELAERHGGWPVIAQRFDEFRREGFRDR